MKRNLFIGSILVLVLALLLAGYEIRASASDGGTVKASTAYVENFGRPPTAEKGLCFARVGYFPLRSNPEKVRPVPLFLFRDSDQLQLLLDRMVSGQLPLPGEGDLFDPFPAGTRIEVQEQKGATVTLNLTFSGKPPVSSDLQGIVAAVTETATQFLAIKRVVILHNGHLLAGSPVEGFAHNPARVMPVGAPALLMVVGSWEKGGERPEEIVANFDRPVKIESFRLEDDNGQRLKGDYFQSVFNMSVVLHPADPSAFREGMSLRAAWDVTDNLGRRGEGEARFQLQRQDYPAPAAGRN